MAQLRTLNEVLENIEFFDTRKHLKKAGGFYSARWNFIKRFKVIGRNDTTGSCLMFGSGPFIHLITEKQGPAKNEEVELETRLCVFEDTNTTVEGIEYLRCAFFLIWGGPYFAIVQVEKVMLGGIVCRGDIVSAGKQILTAKVYDHPNSKNYPAVELYFIDGTMQELTAIRQGRGYEEIPEEIEWQNAMTLYNTYRLPLKPGETLTAAYTGSLGAFIGTSQGRLIAIKDTAIQFVIEPFINDAIKQIVVQHSAVTDVPTLLLFENGTIVSRKNKKRLKKLEGRYTCISDYIFELGDNFAKGEKYIIAGDRDGTVTVIRVDNGHLEIFRTFKNRTFTAITCMVLFSQSYTLLATEAGELQYFDMTQLYRAHPYAPPTGKPIKDKKDVPPSYVVDSNCYYKASVGWFYLRDDKFCRTVPNIPQGHITLLEGKKLNMKYFLACGVPDREIALAYNTSEFNICIIDFTTKVRRTLLKTFGGHQDSGPFRIIQVILMASHVLLQHDTGHAELFMFDWISKSLTSVVYLTKTSGRITAAVCIEYDRNYETSVRYPFDFMMTYLDGSATVRNIDWNGDGSLKRSINFPYVADLKGSYFVSAIASGEHIGNMQCLLLSRKGIVYLAVKGQWPGQKDQVYTTIVQQDLSGILGHGHSLMETCGGILATGFKRHTLKVCRLFMGVKKSRTYCHLFSVDTRSSRLPYTVIEEKLLADHAMTGRVTTKQLIVSYYNKSGGITEEFFSQYDTKFINGTKHTGIITSCFVRDIFKDILQYFYSGDTNGNFCVWSFDDKAVTGQTYLEAFKMDGAVTAIHDIYPYTAVSTSQGGEHYYFLYQTEYAEHQQVTENGYWLPRLPVTSSNGPQGDLHLFKFVNIESIQLQPTIPYNLEQKITYLTSGQNPVSSQKFLLVFLQDGTVQHIKFDNSKIHESKVENIINIKKVAKFPVPTKIGICWTMKKVYYIMALGTDGILRKIQLSPIRNIEVEMKWKISVIKEYNLAMHILLVGDPEGWVYMLMNDKRMGTNFYIDRLHKHEVIDVAYHFPTPHECFMFSMDISGIVAIRQILPAGRPVLWPCAVPSPRKIIIIKEKRTFMIIGRGVAAKCY